MKIPEPENSVVNLINANHESRQEKPRPHFGCSTLGEKCERKLWLNFRWAVIEKFQGRILRLFRRGQDEETNVVNDLRRIGVDVRNTGSKQSAVNFGSHVSGSIDGLIMGGLPGKEKSKAILEIKTHGDKSFKALVKDGVEKSKPMHYAQMQVYMLGSKVDRALYFSINKNDDSIHTEWIKLDRDCAESLVKRGKRIALTERLPEPISNDETWFECRMCAAHDFCHGSKITKEVNCRTCCHSTPLEDSTWKCEKFGETIPADFQLEGCESHVLHPDLVPYKRLPSNNEWEAVYEIDGIPVCNGEPDAYTFSSKEILANPSACIAVINDDPVINEVRNEFDGKIVG